MPCLNILPRFCFLISVTTSSRLLLTVPAENSSCNITMKNIQSNYIRINLGGEHQTGSNCNNGVDCAQCLCPYVYAYVCFYLCILNRLVPLHIVHQIFKKKSIDYKYWKSIDEIPHKAFLFTNNNHIASNSQWIFMRKRKIDPNNLYSFINFDNIIQFIKKKQFQIILNTIKISYKMKYSLST